MSIDRTGAGGPRDAGPLFTAGPRLGWVFRDRRELGVPYAEPEPDPRAISTRLAGQAAAADQALATSWKWLARPSLGLAVILGIAAFAARTGRAGALAALVVLCLPGLAWTGWLWLRRDRLHATSPQQDYQQALEAWQQRAAAHQAAEAARLAGQPEWGSLAAPTPRTDVFGGTLDGWQGLLTVHGASLLAERPLLVADLSGQHAARQLMLAAGQSRVPAAGFRLPQDLGRSGLLADLTPSQLATAIAEAIHAPGPGGFPGPPAGSRSDRALDVRVLQQLAGALSARPVTPQRLAAATQAALGNPDAVPGGILTDQEAERIAGNLFPSGYRDQVMASLIRLDAALADLAAFATGGWPEKAARLTCLIVDPSARSASGEVLTSLLVQWLTVQVATAPPGQPVPAVILAGADEVARAHTERLADVCEAAGVPLTLLFRHLRNDAVSLLGGGTAAFMRLANHAEAEQAATYIGRRHTFAVSSYTATQGGSLTTTQGTSDSYSTGHNASHAGTRSWSDRPDSGPFPGHAHSGGRTRTTGTSTSQTRGTNFSSADGTSWSDTQATQRVYEYAVEPAVLQGLPDHALLLVDRSAQGLRLRAVECDPALIHLPGATTAPLPHQGAFPGIGPYVSPPHDPISPAAPLATLPRPADPVPGHYAAGPPAADPYAPPYAAIPRDPRWDPGTSHGPDYYTGYPPPPPAPPRTPPQHERPPTSPPQPPPLPPLDPPEEPQAPWWQRNPHN